MYLISENFYSNIHGTVKELNRLGVQRFVLHFGETITTKPTNATNNSEMVTIVVFRVDSYPDYLRFCEQLSMIPITTKEFFG